ncbi:hypothetical protein EHS25_007223 [Saitozyma podzolica]|uniref:Uncharacterized protein n=1 Tax=Saitozyma podzolica TaxID=1890683 RepID=A0A427XN09_9TREE|nr:hypothetical protein EHS25_007223 [Saitozyma podzolica]
MPNTMKHVTDVPDMKAVPNILSPAVRLGDTLYLSGQTPIDASGKVVDGDIEELTEQCIRNLEKVLKHSGATLQDVVKVNIFLKSMDDFGRMNAAYEKLMPMPKPARSCIQVAKNPNDVRIEID